MKRTVFVACVFSIAAACPPPHPPTPPPATEFRLQIYVHDAMNQPIKTATVYRDNVPAEVSNPVPVASEDAGAAWTLPPSDFNICAAALGYKAACFPVPLHQNITQTLTLISAPIPPPTPTTWTRDQLTDFQGDLMIWAPGMGCLPEVGIKCEGSGGYVPRGAQAGWVWSLLTWRYSPAHRQDLYKLARSYGWTHYATQVTDCHIESGYHDILPVTDCTGYADKINTVLRETIAAGLIPVCSGVSPTDPPMAGLDTSLCPVVLNDWDNTDQADCRIDALGRAFPRAVIYFEIPQGAITPKPDACSPSPFPTNGGQWLIAVLKRWPNFQGVLYEVNQPDGLDENVDELTRGHVWWRDVQEVVFETDTYWKLREGYAFADSIAYNNALRSRVPWTRGYMSSATPHPAPAPAPPSQDGHFDGELNTGNLTPANAPDFRGWVQSTAITEVRLDLDNVRVTFDKQDGPNRWPDITPPGWSGTLQYSLGLCLRPSGSWVCSAPIELWHGKDGSGGQIQQNGQIPKNWFYDGRWGALNGYQPKAGEQIGVFVLAGDARNAFNPNQERSNIVLFKLPADGTPARFVK